MFSWQSRDESLPRSSDNGIFELEMEDMSVPAEVNLGHSEVHTLKLLQSTVASAVARISTPFDCKLKSDVDTVMAQLGPDETHEQKLQHLADRLRCFGYRITVHASSASYCPGTLQFNLRHSFLCCAPPTLDCILDRDVRVIDIAFKDQFWIASPSLLYRRLLDTVPEVFVGTAESLRPVLETLTLQISESFKQQAMPTPPWRCAQALYSKWFPLGRRHQPASS